MRTLLILIGLLPQTARAAGLEGVGNGPGIAEMWGQIMNIFPHVSGNGVYFLTGRIINFVLLMIGGTAVAVLIYAGIQMIIGAGDDAKIGEAKKTAMYALLGIVFAILADTIMGFVLWLIKSAAA